MLRPDSSHHARMLRRWNSEPTANPAEIAITTCSTVGSTARSRNCAKFSAGLASTYSSGTRPGPGSARSPAARVAGAAAVVAAPIASVRLFSALLPGVKYWVLAKTTGRGARPASRSLPKSGGR